MPGPLAGQTQTVLGAVAPDAVGITLPHEHLLIDFKVMFVEPAASSDTIERLRVAKRRARER